jgi:cytoskeletal protein CcmA (bactofilin family)
MFGKKSINESCSDKMDTLIGKETFFEGNINATGTIRIDGEFKGDIKAKGNLILGENSKVEAAVEARNVFVSGYLKGNLKIEGKVDIASTGQVYGDLLVGNLVIEEGAIFKGNCQMQVKKENNTQEKIDFKARVGKTANLGKVGKTVK